MPVDPQEHTAFHRLQRHQLWPKWVSRDTGASRAHVQTPQRHSEGAQNGTCPRTDAGPYSRSVCCNEQGHYAGKTPAQECVLRHRPEGQLGRYSLHQSKSTGGSRMVAPCSQKLEWSGHTGPPNRRPSQVRRIPDWLGRSLGWKGGYGILEPAHGIHAKQLQGAHGSAHGSQVIRQGTPGQIRPIPYRQRNYSSIHQPPRWLQPAFIPAGYGRVAGGPRPQHPPVRKAPRWYLEYACGQSISRSDPVLLAASPRLVPPYRPGMGSTQHRSVRQYGKRPSANIQQSLLGSPHQRSGCSEPAGLANTQQLGQCPIQTDTQSVGNYPEPASNSHHSSPLVARPTMGKQVDEPIDSSTNQTTVLQTHSVDNGANTRAAPKSTVAVIRMEDIWQRRLAKQGWSPRAIGQFIHAWATSTREEYNRVLTKFTIFLDRPIDPCPPAETRLVADFLCLVADSSKKPRSKLRTTTAALSHLYEGLGVESPVHTPEIKYLTSALVKSGTTEVMEKSLVMPVKPFRDMFMTWKDNEDLSIKDLRMKTITLLALSLMLRPSDIAPKGVIYDPISGESYSTVFSMKHVEFLDENKVKVSFLGIKNDTHRTGFQVTLPPAKDPKLDPVSALRVYIHRTNHCRPPESKPVFLALRAPYNAISAATVGQTMEDAIGAAGLANQGFSAKSFRPTGATHAVTEGLCTPQEAMKIGRWKTQTVFNEHYVHSQVPSTYSEDMMNL